METYSNSLLLLGLILFFGLFIPQLFQRLRLPPTFAMILAGCLAGPNGFNYIQPDETLKLFAFLGSTFYMLLAGFEAEKFHIKVADKKLWILLFFNGLLPALLGVTVARFFHYDWQPAFLLGIIFLSSSIMLVFSYVRHLDIFDAPVGKILCSLVLIEDFAGTMLIFLVFRSVGPEGRFSLGISFGLVVSSVILLRMFLPELVTFVFQKVEESKDEQEGKLRFVLALLIGTVILYSSIGVHPVVGAFLVGFSLATLPNIAPVKEKLKIMGQGVFVPVFLFVLGTESDIKSLFQLPKVGNMVILIIACAFFSKLITGFFGAWVAGFQKSDAIILGLGSTTKLTVSLSAIYAAYENKIVDQNLLSAVVILSVFSAIVTPLILNTVNYYVRKPKQ